MAGNPQVVGSRDAGLSAGETLSRVSEEGIPGRGASLSASPGGEGAHVLKGKPLPLEPGARGDRGDWLSDVQGREGWDPILRAVERT